MNTREVVDTIDERIKAQVLREFRSGNSMEGIARFIVPSPIHSCEGNLEIVEQIIREVCK